MLTGDAAVNPDAPIICCTAEVLANIALREGRAADVGLVVMDEFHFYSEHDRGWAWQVPLIELVDAQFLLMSATLGDVSFFVEDLKRRTGRDTAVVDDAERPVPLSFRWSMEPLDDTLEELVTTGQDPVYVVHFTQAAAVEHATNLLKSRLGAAGGGLKVDKEAIAERIGGFRFGAGLRQDALAHGAQRHRRPPRRHAAEVPPAGGDARPGRAAARHLRHRHPRRRHQRADPHRAVHRAGQVRRHQAAGAPHPGVPADRRAGRAARATTRPATSSYRPPSTSSRTSRPRPRPRRGSRPARRSPRPSSRSRPRAPSCGPSRPSTSWSPECRSG